MMANTMTTTAPKTVGEAKKEIHRLRKEAEQLAGTRDDVVHDIRAGRYAQNRIYNATCGAECITARISDLLTRALHLEYHLPENTIEPQRAADWWANLQRTAREAEEEEARARTRPYKRGDGEPVRVRTEPMRYWEVTTRCRKSGEDKKRYYAHHWLSGVQSSLRARGNAWEVVSIEEVTEAEYIQGAKTRSYPISGRAALN